MAIVAMIVLGFLIFLMTSTRGFWRGQVELVTYMDDSAAVSEGSPVRLNGILIGKVSAVELSGSTEPRRVVRMKMLIDDQYLKEIPVDSVAAIAAENVLGTKYINIKKGTSQQTVKPGAEIASLDTRSFDEVVQQGYPLLLSLQETLKKINDIVSEVEVGHGTIGKLLVDETLYNKIVAIADQVQKITEALNSDKGTFGKLVYSDDLYNDVRQSLARVDNLLEGVQKGQGTLGKLVKDPALYNEARNTLVDVRKILADLNAGKGTAGKLLKSDDLHNQLAATIAKVDVTLDKINSGQGTLGQLLLNPSLYNSMDGATQELQGLLKDFRANPKKFLRIKLGLF